MTNNTYNIHIGDNQQILPTLPDNSVDSIVTDPPYELGFMGKTWDATGIAYNVEMWRECLRVLKPGGHLLAFSGSRTYHRMAVAIEDAGFQIRDQIMWVYGSGFPKSLNISKAIDKAAGAERQDRIVEVRGKSGSHENPTRHVVDAGTPSTAEAKEWDGWGTALKPAHEPIVLARKPLDGTVAKNVLTHGVGGLNIDGCRVGRADGDDSSAGNRTATFGTQEVLSGGDGSGGWQQNEQGRFPANFIHDGSDEVLQLFPDTKNISKGSRGRGSDIYANGKGFANTLGEVGQTVGYGDSGSAARFFYCAKANKKDRNEGLDDMPDLILAMSNQAKAELKRGNLHKGDSGVNSASIRKNNHPTVKPTELMRYLCRLITPPNGVILDPFTGSGSTGKAALLEGFNFIGIEQSEEYAAIAKARIEHVTPNE